MLKKSVKKELLENALRTIEKSFCEYICITIGNQLYSNSKLAVPELSLTGHLRKYWPELYDRIMNKDYFIDSRLVKDYQWTIKKDVEGDHCLILKEIRIKFLKDELEKLKTEENDA